MLGERLASARKQAGLSQFRLAMELGDRYDRTMIGHVEHNRSALLLDGAAKAARTLGVSLDYLAGLTDHSTPAQPIQELAKRLAQGYLKKLHPGTFGKPSLTNDPREMRKLEQELEKLATEIVLLYKDDLAPQLTNQDTFSHLDLDKLLAAARAKVSELEDAGALAPADSREFRPVLLTQGTGIAAGAGANAADERVLGSLAFRDDWLKRHSLNTAQCRVIEVIGDSMEPTLQHRAMILVDFQRTVRRHNKIFAVRADDGPVVKRLQHDDDGWQLASDNKAYKPVPWPRDAQVLGQVMWTGRTL